MEAVKPKSMFASADMLAKVAASAVKVAEVEKSAYDEQLADYQLNVGKLITRLELKSRRGSDMRGMWVYLLFLMTYFIVIVSASARCPSGASQLLHSTRCTTCQRCHALFWQPSQAAHK
jgi:hypothetical protein